MNVVSKNTIRSGWNSLKSYLVSSRLGQAVASPNFLKVVVTLSLLLQLVQCTHCTGQSVQAMVKQQPFPYATGVAMDTATYQAVRAKLQAADQLKRDARRAIDSLLHEVNLTYKGLLDQQALRQHESTRLNEALTRMQLIDTQLSQATTKLKQAEQIRDAVLQTLPRRIRKQLTTASPDVVAEQVATYIKTQQRRKWSWASVSLTGGFVLGVLTALF
ncbi:hypothetical protein IC229_05840 [Spirosoma sp. BT702]|uniref:Uncharacterized protein n=1 Tax=Spirosoma profusum TaxID=2771354 RepID=A0A926XU17_9BACT|nr:hypothetical protein [Spirosoma profusum]MBD2700147.1 hypothetical protein [Spirosoma profusum]